MRRKTSVVCIGVGSCLLPDASVEARARLQRCGRLTSPMIRLLRGVCQHPSPLMSRGGRSQAIPAGSFDAEARAAWQVGMAACNRRTVLQIRRYDSRRSSPSVLGSDSTLDPREDYFPTSWTARKPVPGEDGGWHRPGSSVVRTFGPFPIGPAVASAFPCVSRRPDLAVARAGIAESKERR